MYLLGTLLLRFSSFAKSWFGISTPSVHMIRMLGLGHFKEVSASGFWAVWSDGDLDIAVSCHILRSYDTSR